MSEPVKHPIVQVALATHNGERYLAQQLHSLRNQRDVTIELIVFDDASKDDTLLILDSYKEKFRKVTLIESAFNLGSTTAYMVLASIASPKHFLAFCDQDDIWEENKLIEQIKLITENGLPTAVGCQRLFINEIGEEIGHISKAPTMPLWQNAIVENSLFGNTILLNPCGVSHLQKHLSFKILNYDHWIYLLFSLSGEVLISNNPLVRYRLHGSNQIGLGKRYSLINTVKALLEHRYQIDQILESKIEWNNSEIADLVRSYQQRYMNGNMLKNISSLKQHPGIRVRHWETIFYKIFSTFVTKV